jgi:cytochrome P450
MDPPAHGHHRKLVSPSMTVRRIGALEPRVRAITVEVLDAVEARGATVVDVVDDIAAPVPTLVIAELLGVPPEDLATFRRWSDTMIAAATEMTEDGLVQAAELFAYMSDIVEARRGEPRDDLISVLVAGEVDGERLTENDIGMFCMTLLVAGNETTRTLLSNGLLALAQQPDQRAALANGGDTAVATEELLRWEAPIQMMCRTANTDTTIGDTTINEDDYVVLFYGSANRDEAVFGPTAASLDVTRDPNPHLAFGYGEHFCLGAGLARLEGRIVIEEVLRRWPDYALAGDVERLPSLLVRGIERLPIALHP